jgi:lipopolysaccharide export system protein LptC
MRSLAMRVQFVMKKEQTYIGKKVEHQKLKNKTEFTYPPLKKPLAKSSMQIRERVKVYKYVG